MDSIPAAALPIVAATDGQPTRDALPGDAGDLGTFEQALEKEISLINPAPAQAPADPALAALANSDAAARTDNPQFLDVILDSAGMLAAGAAAAATPGLDTIDAATDVRPASAGETALKAARTPRLPDSARREAPVDIAEKAVATTPATATAHINPAESAAGSTIAKVSDTASDMALETQRRFIAAAQSPATPRAAAATAAAPASPSNMASEPTQAIAPAAHSPTPTSEMLAARERTFTAPATSERPGIQAMGSNSAREASRARSASDDLLAPRVELRSDSIGSDAGGISVATAPVTAPESAVQSREATPSLDTLSSATLMHRWTPTPHHPANGAAVTPAIVRIDTPLAAPGWSDALRQQVVWLVDRQLETAELHVNPPNLGPVEVVLKVTDDGARIAFCSPHAAVREAIEASLSELRSGLAERGLALGQALVSADPGSAREHMMRDENVRGGPRTPDVVQADAERETRGLPPRRGLVDTFV